MSILRKVTLVTAVSLVMAGCASTRTEQQQYSSAQVNQEQSISVKTKRQQIEEELSPNITFAPAIDVTYADVVNEIDQNIGTDVRWGGHVVESTLIDDSTIRLTVFGYPLSSDGRPEKPKKSEEKHGRFIVDLKDSLAKSVDFKGRLITLYGSIASQLVVTNGDRQKAIPIITAKELVDWNRVDQVRSYAKNLRNRSYYNLGYRRGYYGLGYGYYYPFYGKSYFGYKNRHLSFGFSKGFRSFGHRGFSGRGFRRH